jgi:hypothetical protein
MVKQKMRLLNRIQTHLQKLEFLISFYEQQAADSGDLVCGSFLKNVADKKSLQLIVTERMLSKHGIAIFPLSSEEAIKNNVSSMHLSQARLEDIYDFISKQSLNDLKNLLFLSLEDQETRPVFNTMSELEEDFLIFVECDYIHHLAQSSLQSVAA